MLGSVRPQGFHKGASVAAMEAGIGKAEVGPRPRSPTSTLAIHLLSDLYIGLPYKRVLLLIKVENYWIRTSLRMVGLGVWARTKMAT